MTGLLDAQILVQARDVIVKLGLEAGEVLALVGPNGAGKSTVLQSLSGVLPGADESSIVLNGADIAALPPHRRRITLLGQDPTLFPHLTVTGNVAFGLRAAGASRTQARSQAYELLEVVDCAELAGRKPHQISGGQAQRVAIARALAATPELLLLDEPLVALDADQAPQLRHLLRRVLRERNQAAIIITHDLVDAVTLADSVAVLQQGRVIERGLARSVLGSPRSQFAASLAGMNLLTGTIEGGRLRCVTSPANTQTGDSTVQGADELTDGAPQTLLVSGSEEAEDRPAEGGQAVALFSPASVSVHPRTPQGSPRNAFHTTISTVESHGAGVRVRGRCAAGPLSADITAAALAELDLAPGDRVWFSVKAQEVRLVPSA